MNITPETSTLIVLHRNACSALQALDSLEVLSTTDYTPHERSMMRSAVMTAIDVLEKTVERYGRAETGGNDGELCSPPWADRR